MSRRLPPLGQCRCPDPDDCLYGGPACYLGEERKRRAMPSAREKLQASRVTKEEIRDLVRANLFDGQDGGQVTMRVDYLLNEIADILLGRD